MTAVVDPDLNGSACPCKNQSMTESQQVLQALLGGRQGVHTWVSSVASIFLKKTSSVSLSVGSASLLSSSLSTRICTAQPP